MKVVNKPWGRECWIEINARYCLKRIELNARMRTSLQLHERKIETNVIITGEAIVVLDDSDGHLVEQVLGPGSSFTVYPFQRHRVTALTDVVMIEASTPDVDDVIRLDDDAGRPDGRIESEHE